MKLALETPNHFHYAPTKFFEWLSPNKRMKSREDIGFKNSPCKSLGNGAKSVGGVKGCLPLFSLSSQYHFCLLCGFI